MASKSSTVILPLALGLCVWWVERGWRWRNAWRLAPYFVLAGLSSSLAIWTQRLEGAGEPEWARSWAERLITAGKLVWFYLGKLLWPEPLIFIYPRWEVNPGQVMAYLPLALVVVGLGILSLWHDTLAKHPGCWMAHNNLGTLLQNRGELGKAIEHFEQVLQLKPDSAQTHNNLGNALAAQGNWVEAIQHLHEALNLATAQANPVLAKSIRTRLQPFPSPVPQPQSR